MQKHENKNQSTTNEESQTKSGGNSSFKFVDNRPETIAQLKLQEGIRNAAPTQLMEEGSKTHAPVQAAEGDGTPALGGGASTPNNTGMPDDLKAGIESLSGYSMDDVTVHYNSDKPEKLGALAYAHHSEGQS